MNRNATVVPGKGGRAAAARFSGTLMEVGVKPPVTVSTKRYEIIFLIVTEVTSVLNVVDLKVLLATAPLAAPVVSV